MSSVNNSGKGPVNSLANDDHFELGELGRIRDQFHTVPATIRALTERGKRAINESLKAAEDVTIGNKSMDEFEKIHARNERIRANVNSRVSIYEETKQDRLNDQAVNLINRQFSPSAINSYVQRNANSLEAQVAGASLTGQGYMGLDVQRKQIMGQMNELRNHSMSVASTYIDQNQINPAAASVLEGGSEQMKELAKQLVPITVAMQQLKQQGQDPKSRHEELGRIGNKAASLLHNNELAEQFKSGQGLGQHSLSELKKKEAEAAEKLIKALTALNSAAGKTTDELNALNKDAEEAAKNFKDIGDAKEFAGKNNGNKFDTIKMIAGTIMEVLDIGTNAYQNVAINQPMQMVSNTAGAANLENQKYNSWHAALAGNMHERMNLDWRAAQGFGNTLANNQNNVHTMRGINYGIGGALGAAQVGVSIYNGVTSGGGAISGINPIEQAAQGAKSFASGAAGGIVEMAANQRQTEMAALRIEGQRAFMAAQKALTQISGQQLQGYRDYSMGINETAGALGGQSGEGFLGDVGGSMFLQRLSDAGIGTREFNSLSLRTANQAGSRFNTDQIFQAVDFERNLGIGNADINMQRIGALSASGQGNGAADLGRILERAVANGMNSSKAVDMLVENTARMSEQAIATGGTGEGAIDITRAIMAAVNPNNPNKELGLKLAQAIQQSAESARTNVATSAPGIINVDRNMKALGVDRLSATLITKIPTSELMRLGGMDEASARLELETRGIDSSGMNSSLFKDGAWAQTIRVNQSTSELAQQSGVGYATGNPGAFMQELIKNKDNAKIRNALIYGGQDLALLSDSQRSLRRGVAAGYSLNDNSSSLGMANAATLAGVTDEASAVEAQLKLRQNLTDEKRLGGAADSARAKEGAVALGGNAASAISALAESGRQAFEKMGKNAENVWGKAAQETAANLGNSATLMDSASRKLETAATEMTKNTQLMAASGASFASAVSDAIAKIKDKLGMLDKAGKSTMGHEEIARRIKNMTPSTYDDVMTKDK